MAEGVERVTPSARAFSALLTAHRAQERQHNTREQYGISVGRTARGALAPRARLRVDGLMRRLFRFSQCCAWITVACAVLATAGLHAGSDPKAAPTGYDQESSNRDSCDQAMVALAEVKGRTAQSFRERSQRVNDAKSGCAAIGAPPAELAAELSRILDTFEFTRADEAALRESLRLPESEREAVLQQRPVWAWWLTTHPPFRSQLESASRFEDRLLLVQAYVDNRARVFAVLEASTGMKTDADVQTLLAAMKSAPKGGSYGSRDVRLVVATALFKPSVSAEPILEFIRKEYPPAELDQDFAFPLSNRFSEDGRVTDSEWDYISAVHAKKACVPCMRSLLAVSGHASSAARTTRFFNTLKTVNARTPAEAFRALMPLDAPGLFLAV